MGIVPKRLDTPAGHPGRDEPGADVSHGSARVNEPLRGVRIALLEARMESELASLVRRHGGEPLCVPAMREIERDCADEIRRAQAAIVRGGAVVVLTTGVGLERVLSVSTALGLSADLRSALGAATVVCRGPKPIAVLKREGLPVHLRAAPPHTLSELLATLDSVEVEGRDVVFVHDGGVNREAVDHLSKRGAKVFEVQPYVWSLPEELGALRGLVETIVRGEVDVVAFTTQTQARHLFAIADTMGARDALAVALNERVLVAAVGPTCARALTQLGATVHVMPEPSKMGAMVLAIAAHLAR